MRPTGARATTGTVEGAGGPTTVVLVVDESSRVGTARRAAESMAQAVGLGPDEIGRVGLVATEAATNLARHARRGQMLLRGLFAGGRRGLEIVAADAGPGMSDLERVLRDGYSSAGSAGEGLGAIRRRADAFDLHSRPDAGTVLLARVWDGRATTGPSAVPRGNLVDESDLELGVVCRPVEGETACGDAWAIDRRGDTLRVILVDGLGHGPDAALAADEAIRVLRRHQGGPEDSLDAAHATLRATRGAAAAVADIRAPEGEVRFAGVGNIAAMLVTVGDSRSLVSHNGIVGHQMRRAPEQRVPWTAGGTLLAHTDGLTTHWRLADYAGLVRRHPALLAAALFRDHARARDDATVLVVREFAGGTGGAQDA